MPLVNVFFWLMMVLTILLAGTVYINNAKQEFEARQALAKLRHDNAYMFDHHLDNVKSSKYGLAAAPAASQKRSRHNQSRFLVQTGRQRSVANGISSGSDCIYRRVIIHDQLRASKTANMYSNSRKVKSKSYSDRTKPAGKHSTVA